MSEIVPVLDQETGELVEVADGAAATLFGTKDPKEVIERARLYAQALKSVVDDRKLTKRIRGKDHILIEGWTLLGSMVGVFPVEDVPVQPVEVDGVVGFKSTVKAVTRDGAVVGRATAFCMKDEENWRSADTFALASMAQTRAASKALRLPLGFIVQLAGYATTPADEMPEDRRPVDPADLISEAQKTKLALLRKEAIELGVYKDEEEFAKRLRQGFGVESLVDLSREDASRLITVIQGRITEKTAPELA